MADSTVSHDKLARRGLMFILSSPSGAGKTTISRMLLDADDEIKLSVSVTTRPCLRPGANPFKDPRIAIYLRPTQEEDYFTLVKERSVPIELPGGDARYCETG